MTQSTAPDADVELRLIDEKDFQSALQAAFGAKIAQTFVARTDPQCMTSVKSTADGDIVHSVSFIIVDKGDDVFLDCAYHELLHAFGLSNHDQRNPWTTLNQKRMVGYLTVYDRSLLTLLYDVRIRPGMTARQARAVLPQVIASLGLAAATRADEAALLPWFAAKRGDCLWVQQLLRLIFGPPVASLCRQPVPAPAGAGFSYAWSAKPAGCPRDHEQTAPIRCRGRKP